MHTNDFRDEEFKLGSVVNGIPSIQRINIKCSFVTNTSYWKDDVLITETVYLTPDNCFLVYIDKWYELENSDYSIVFYRTIEQLLANSPSELCGYINYIFA